VDVYALGP